MSNTQIDTSRVSFVTITEANDDQRVDNFLLSALKGVPKPLVYRILRKGEVRVNKGRVKADTRIHTGDLVRIPPIRLPQKAPAPEITPELRQSLSHSILYEDEGLLAVNKPHGLAVHGGSGVSLGLIEGLRKMRPSHEYLELVHRLDRDTSGIILIAKKRKVLTALQRMLANQKGVRKRYLALVHGHWPKKIKAVAQPLQKIELPNGDRTVVVNEAGKESLTKVRWLAQGAHYSLIEAEPITGRTHQIRVHCQSQGYSIAGDNKYCDNVLKGIDRKQQIARLCLHAHQLSFRHPITGEQLSLTAPPESLFVNILKKVGCDVAL